MRLFIGVWLSEAMKKEVLEYIKRIQKSGSGWKWTTPDNLHFTLRFLGEVPEYKVADLARALKTAVAGESAFRLSLGKAGFFPTSGPPRILWLDVAVGGDSLVKLAGAVENCCRQQGFPKADKPFKPHLTIARAKSDLPKINLAEPEFKFKSETGVTGVALIESRLFSAGPVYQTIELFKLVD